MPYKYSFDSVAAKEYEKAYIWYRQRSETAADNLLIRVEEEIRAICADPYRYRNTYKNLRELSKKNTLIL
jgi:plasmid stabilization system protein ParE